MFDLDKILRSTANLENSLASACTLREQWRIVTQQNLTNLNKKEADQTKKTLKNKLLATKWDCEDLEDLIRGINADGNEVVQRALKCIEQARVEVLEIMNELEGFETRNKILNKHGISLQDAAQAAITSLTNSHESNSSRYERLLNDGDVVFDRNQIEPRPNIYENQLHDYYEYEETYKNKSGFNPADVFENLTKPLTSVQTSPNDNETILGMLETEYYDPPQGLMSKSNFKNKIETLTNSLPVNPKAKFGLTIGAIVFFVVLARMFFL